jgi:hypothetical protein
MNNLTRYLQAHWKLIVAAAAPILIIAIIFSLPLKTVPVPVTETYWETEMKVESYVTTETYTDMEPYITTESRMETIVNQPVGYGGWSQSFTIDKPDTTVYIDVKSYGGGWYSPRFIVIGDNHSPYYSPWSSWSPWYWDNYYGGGQSWATVRITYPEQVTKYRPVSKTREVTKYREVPTQVRKEKTVTQYVKMSMWESMFR